MVRSCQTQQLDATRSWADAVERQVAGARRDLASLASHPDVCRLGESERLLESFQKLHSEALVVEKALSSVEQESVPCRFS